MNRRDLFKLPVLAILPKGPKEKRNKFVYRYYVPYCGGKRLWHYATYVEGDEFINLKGQYIDGDENFWKLRYGKTALFLMERDWHQGKCEKQVCKEGDWLHFTFDRKSRIG